MIDVFERLELPGGRSGRFASLPRLAARGIGRVARLPVCIRILLESVLRNVDGRLVTDADVEELARWQPGGARTDEIPFTVGRVLLQDFTGVPLLVDLAAMREEIVRRGGDPARVQTRVPVDLVCDHSIQVDHAGRPDALRLNMELELARNLERYRFLKWGAQAFEGLTIVPPGVGICHQVNLERLARGVLEQRGTYFFDTLVGTDSHTTMVNGLGVLAWGVGGIEAEAAMLGEPIHVLVPDVIGVCLTGRLREGVTATDLVLRITELLRKTRVVGKLVEFHGDGAAALTVPDRATVGNMAPEYGATIGFFPTDERSLAYLTQTGREAAHVDLVHRYHDAQGLFGMPERGQLDYTHVVELDLTTVEPSVAGPGRPQDRIPLGGVKARFLELLTSADGYHRPAGERRVSVRAGVSPPPLPGGGQQAEETVPDEVGTRNTNPDTEREMMDDRPTSGLPAPPIEPAPRGGSSSSARRGAEGPLRIGHGDVVIAAITSCTNTSNPQVMLAAGLLAKKAVQAGLGVESWVKTSLAPGSRVVTAYLEKTGLQAYLDRLGFHVVGYGCTTCIGNSGPLARPLEEAITKHEVVCAAVLSGNRNFEARIHQSVKANFLMSPPLVVAYAIAGRVDIDLTEEPLGVVGGQPIFLADIWPTTQEIEALLAEAADPATYLRVYDAVDVPTWDAIPTDGGLRYAWDAASTYIREPPYFDPEASVTPGRDVCGARALAIFGDSITTDHISPAGAIPESSPAGRYLAAHGVEVEEFNSYGARRGNHEVMIRGTFANVRIRNLMVPGAQGGVTVHQPGGERLSIADAAERYHAEGVPLLVFGGQDYGSGSSRDWAAKGTRLLGVRAVIARTFERIHRANLVGMGVLPCKLDEGVSAQTLGLDGSETFDLELAGALRARGAAHLRIARTDGRRETVPITLAIDTPVEIEQLVEGGILPYVLGRALGRAGAHGPA